MSMYSLSKVAGLPISWGTPNYRVWCGPIREPEWIAPEWFYKRNADGSDRIGDKDPDKVSVVE